MKAKIGKWLSTVLPLFLGIFLIYYSYNQFSEKDIEEIKKHFKNANYFYLNFSIFIAFLGSASRAYRWKYALDHMGYKTSFANNFMAVSIGYLMNMTVPRSGEISRALVLKKYNGVPFDKAFGSIIAERIVDMIILLGLIVVAFFVQYDILKTFILDKIPLQKLIFLLAIGLAFFITFIILYLYSKLNFILKLKDKISGLKEGILSVLHMKKKWSYLAYTIFIWFSYIYMFYIGLLVISETNMLPLSAVITSFIVGSVAIAFTNSGFGSYPFLMAKILLIYNISETAGSAFGWIIWTTQMLLLVFLGALSFLLLPVLNRSK